MLNLCLTIGFFWPSMRLCSAVSRAAVFRVIEAVKATDPADGAAWKANVETPALALEATMRLLSEAGSGLVAICQQAYGA